MRELKFRAWDDLNKKWLMGYEYPSLGGFSLTGESILFGEWGNCFDKFIFEREGRKKEHLIIEQFINKSDKNGKPIYEGDIIKCGEQNCIVVFGKVTLGFGYHFEYKTNWNKTSKFYRINGKDEVIGNIHENPELIK